LHIPAKVHVTFLVLIAICCVAVCSAQIPSETDVTSTPVAGVGHDYIQGPAETVNPANGSLSIRIGVPIPPSRGFSVPFNFAYDSNGAYYLATPCSATATCQGFKWVTTQSRLAQGGWSYSVPMLSVQSASATMQTLSPTEQAGTFACQARTNFVLQDAQGNRRNLGLTYFNTSNTCQGNDSTNESGSEGAPAFPSPPVLSAQEGSLLAQTTGTWTGAGISNSPGVVNPVTVTDGDGTVYQFAQEQAPPLGCCNTTYGTFTPASITDRNGNSFTVSSTNVPGSPALTYTDTIGRTALSIPTFGASPDDVSVAGLTIPYKVSWTTVSASFPITMTPFSGNGTCTGPGAQPPIQAVSAITFPNGEGYTFTYDPIYGQVSKITYPTGGYVRYVWGLNPKSEYGSWPIYTIVASGQPGSSEYIQYPVLSGTCQYYYDSPAISERFVSYDGEHEVLEQMFQYSTNWTPSEQAGYWVTKQTTVTTFDQVRNTNYSTTYTYSPVNADFQPNVGDGLPVPVPVETSEVYTDTTGATLETVGKTWTNERMMTKQTTKLGNNEVSESDWQYNTNEMETNRYDYDYGSGVRGALLRQTVIQYAPFNAHIVDKPQTVELEDASGSVVAGVTYGYGGVTGVGNVLTRSNWLNATGSSALTTTHLYDPYGNMTSTTDPKGNTTTYAYTNSWEDTCSFTPSPSAYLTSITYPSTNGVAHTESFKYFCNLGYLAQSTDQNGQVTSYQYNDPLGRPTETVYPSGWGTGTTAYNDTPGEVSIETKRIDSSGTTWGDIVTLFDGIGHQISQSSANGESSPWNRSDTCLDGDGRALYKMYPYQTSSATGEPGCSGPKDTFAYDALGRGTSVTHSDSTAATTTYTGRATDVKDEGNGTRSVERISQSDALGRLTNVCEVTGSTQYGVSPAVCPNLDYTGTGFATSYAYNARGDLTGVTQGSQSRSFVYDFLSRLTQSNNPAESGTINYTYDSNPSCTAQASYPGELISKTDARSITTCMQYDALHRITGKTYSDGTPTVAFGYDETSKLGHSLTNTKGRMSSESTAGANPTGSIFSYDTMGHVIDNSQCTPANCSGTPYPVTYTAYNVLGGPATATDGAGHTFNYSYNVGGRLTSLGSSLVGANYPATLISALHYNAFGSEVSSTIGGAPLTDEREYDVRGRITAISVANPSATDSGATVTISGTEKSSGPPTHGTGWVTIQGQEDSGTFCDDAGNNCHFKYNAGSISATVNGTVYSVTYGSTSTPTTLAASLATAMNGSLVTATAAGPTVTVTTIAAGTSANYSLSGNSTTNDPTDFSGPSFGSITSGTSLTGGASGSAPYDTGTVTATINGYAFSAPYGQYDTNTTVAQSLANSININSPTALATASGSVVSLQSRDPGSTVDFTLSGSSASGNGFSPASFSLATSGADMTGGTGNSIYSAGVSYLPNSDLDESYDSVNGSWKYTYDDFNRLNTAVSNTGLGCAEVYDRFGNRLQQTNYTGTCMTPQYTLTANTYHIAGFSYDLAGDMIGDGIHTYQYDGEGRLASLDSGSTATYVYDAGGTRVRRIVSGVAYDEVLDLTGHVISDFLVSNGAWNRGEVYAGGMHVATYMPSTANTYFVHSDWLGNERVRSTPTGTIYSSWTSYPFGEGSLTPNPGPTHFTGKERDTESGNDYFEARYYASSMGRFMSPDWSAKEDPVPYAQLDDPQSLNLYSYVRNNPLARVDADGHCFEDACVLEGGVVVGGGGALLMYGGAVLAGAVGLTGLAQTLHNNGDSIMSGVKSLGNKIGSIFHSENSSEKEKSGEGQAQTGENDHAGQGVQSGSKDRTAQGTQNQVEGIGHHQAEMTKKAKAEAAESGSKKKIRYRPTDDKSQQNDNTNLKKIKSQADADAEHHQ
jgi:RHS repeat-associated protein